MEKSLKTLNQGITSFTKLICEVYSIEISHPLILSPKGNLLMASNAPKVITNAGLRNPGTRNIFTLNNFPG